MSTDAATSAHIDHLTWSDALARMDWRQGEHVTLIGPTGVGKTELMVELMRMRRWCVFLNTKKRDATQAALKRELGFRTIRDANAMHPELASRYIVAPSWTKRDGIWPWSPSVGDEELDKRHARVFREALTRAFWQENWTVGIDELEYINRDLKIESPVNRLLRQGRSQGNSMILGTQRPRHVTLHAYEQATHMFMWRQADLSNIVRASELAGVNRSAVLEVLPHLKKHDTLYINTIDGDMFVTNTRA